MNYKRILTLLYLLFFQTLKIFADSWDCQILPPEHHIEYDTNSGAKIIFVTTNQESDRNLYFHDRCFLYDNQIMLFISDRFGRSEIMGYLLKTGELVRLNKAEADQASNPLASVKGDILFVARQNSIYQWKLELSTESKTAVNITETKLAEIPDGGSQVSGIAENCDATLLAFAYSLDSKYFVDVFDVVTGEVRNAATMDFKIDHLQFHHHRPDILSFSRSYGSDWAPLDKNLPAHARIWFLNVNTHIPVPAFYQVPGELVTHECWWINDQITFIGGHRRDNGREEGHVKVLDIKTGDIRIIGAGAWWDEGTAHQLTQVNWWHASGSPNGKWIAADNWHGIIAIFDAKTTEKKILTTGHRIYGGGAHLHVGWDTQGRMVEFTSNKYGNPDVCIGIIPENW